MRIRNNIWIKKEKFNVIIFKLVLTKIIIIGDNLFKFLVIFIIF